MRTIPILSLCVLCSLLVRPARGQSVALDSIMLERTPCFGRCPAYRVLITRAGLVRFWRAGDSGTPTASDSVPQRPFMAEHGNPMIAKVLSLPDRLEMTPLCSSPPSDASYTVLTLFTARGAKRIVDYLACSRAPIELRQLEQLVDSTAHVDRWIHRG